MALTGQAAGNLPRGLSVTFSFNLIKPEVLTLSMFLVPAKLILYIPSALSALILLLGREPTQLPIRAIASS